MQVRRFWAAVGAKEDHEGTAHWGPWSLGTAVSCLRSRPLALCTATDGLMPRERDGGQERKIDR